MTSTTIGFERSGQDLRTPLLRQLSKRISGGWRRVITLLLLDICVLWLSWQVTASCDRGSNIFWYQQPSLFPIGEIIAIQIGLIAARGLYQHGNQRRNYFDLIKTLVSAHLLLLLIAFFGQIEEFVSQQSFILSLLLGSVLICTERFTVNTFIKYLRQRGLLCHPICLICSLADKDKAIKILEKENNYHLLGWVDINSIAQSKKAQEQTLEKIYQSGVSEVFLCSWESISNKMCFYWKLRSVGITLHILPIHLETVGQNLELKMVGQLPTLKLALPLIAGSDFLIKRCFDFCFTTILIILLSPLLLLISLLIKLDSPGTIFYRQTRVGLHGREFKVWKFRTMVTNADQMQKDLETSNEMKDGVLFKIKNDPRITRLGKFLRASSLDELPQLFNVLRGEMSLVGPRPLPSRDVEKFAEHHFIRQEVLPGITGFWQVSGRSDITNFDRVVSLDVKYMENWSLWLDIQILLKTIAVVLGRQGAY